MHNSAVCYKRKKQNEDSNDDKNALSNYSKNGMLKMKALFHQGSQKSYVTNRVKRILFLTPSETKKLVF